MSRGYGRVQREALKALRSADEGMRVKELCVIVYGGEEDSHTEAQLRAMRRALAGLVRDDHAALVGYKHWVIEARRPPWSHRKADNQARDLRRAERKALETSSPPGASPYRT
jgi:hypothetical protein